MQFPASTSQLAQEFWDFSLSLYARPSVAAELLEWQDRRGANVNLALLCIWAGERGRVLSSADIAKAETALAGWSAAVTKPLREIRRRQKAVWRNLAPDPEPARQAVKQAELTAERTEQLILVQPLAGAFGSRRCSGPGEPCGLFGRRSHCCPGLQHRRDLVFRVAQLRQHRRRVLAEARRHGPDFSRAF